MRTTVESEPAKEPKRVLLVRPRGFCAGVVRAIEVVELALKRYGVPVYVRKEIVHNFRVVERLRLLGAIFVEELTEVPPGAVVIFSAHGVSPQVRREAQERGLQIIDATCPLVTKVHLELVRFAREGRSIILIGQKDHDEVIGTMGEAPDRTFLVSSVEDIENLRVPHPDSVAYLTQTTLSLDDTREIIERLKIRFPAIQGPPSQDICYATQNRQMAVKAVACHADLMLVLGSQNSSNSMRLVEMGCREGLVSHLIDSAAAVDLRWLVSVRSVAVTAGASVPEDLVQDLIRWLRGWGFSTVQEFETAEENLLFPVPVELRERESQLVTIPLQQVRADNS